MKDVTAEIKTKIQNITEEVELHVRDSEIQFENRYVKENLFSITEYTFL